MQLLDHVSITVPRLDEARPFYDAVMDALARPRSMTARTPWLRRTLPRGRRRTPICRFASPQAGSDARRHWCFKAPSRSAVDRFHAAGLAHGGRDDGAPGLRPHYHPHYYAAFLLDPCGIASRPSATTLSDARGAQIRLER